MELQNQGKPAALSSTCATSNNVAAVACQSSCVWIVFISAQKMLSAHCLTRSQNKRCKGQTGRTAQSGVNEPTEHRTAVKSCRQQPHWPSPNSFGNLNFLKSNHTANISVRMRLSSPRSLLPHTEKEDQNLGATFSSELLVWRSIGQSDKAVLCSPETAVLCV